MQSFIAQALVCSRGGVEPCDAVLALAEPMMELAASAKPLLAAMDLQSRTEGYTRNLIHARPIASGSSACTCTAAR